MKKILIKKIKLLNFCGVREGEYDFGESITTISAGNGKGKSTISNAINYVLFGTDSMGNSLDIKTFDVDHNIIREIPHEATIVLSVDGEGIELGRTLVDSWKDDKCTNTFKYYIDEEVTTAGDFKQAINNIFYDVAFGWAINPNRFLSEDWKKQRAFLQTLVGDVTSEDITHGDKKFDFVVESLKKQDIDKLIHHIRYKRNEVQKQLDEVPVRLQELSQTLPEKEDYDELQAALDKQESELTTVDSKISAVSNGATQAVKNDATRHRLEFARKRVDEMIKSARKLAEEEETKHNSDIINAHTAHSSAHTIVEELQAKMRGYTDTEIHLNEQMELHEQDIKKAKAEYLEVNAEQWEWNDEDSFCPHCGQALPINEVTRIKGDSLYRFNESKATRMKELIEVANKINSQHSECKKLMEQLDDERRITTNQLVSAQKAAKEADVHLAEVQKETPKTYNDILNAKEEYQQVSEEIAKLEDELSHPNESNDEEKDFILNELKENRKVIAESVNSLRSRLAYKDTFLKVSARIEELKSAKETYQNQLDELDEKLDIANEYNQLSCSILEDRVNKHFRFVKWSLFKSNLDGEKKPYCECYHDGVPYSRLNGAAKVNAGIDIAYTIAKHYDVSCPMVLDECESNLHPTYNGGQQIRLCVADYPELTFEYSDGNQDEV